MKYADIYIGQEITKIVKLDEDTCLVFTKTGVIYTCKAILPTQEKQFEDICNVTKTEDRQSPYFHNYNSLTSFKGIVNLNQLEKIYELPIKEAREFLEDKLCFKHERIDKAMRRILLK
jgi:hypothetical protein